MVKIRLARFGRKNLPSYRLVVTEARSKRNGEAIEYLGTYDTKPSPSKAAINKERVEYWLSVGAQPTETVRGILVKEGLMKAIKRTFKKKPGNNKQTKMAAESEAKQAPVEKKEEAAKETKVEEIKTEVPVEVKE